MNTRNGIIITTSIEEAVLLHDLVGDFNFKKEAYNPPIFSQPFSYKKEWVWVYRNKELSGSSGYNALKHTIDTNPDLKIYSVKQFSEIK